MKSIETVVIKQEELKELISAKYGPIESIIIHGKVFNHQGTMVHVHSGIGSAEIIARLEDK